MSEKYFKILGPCASGIKELCVLCLFQLSVLNCTSIHYGYDRMHESSNSPPGLGRTQGCGFWADTHHLMSSHNQE